MMAAERVGSIAELVVAVEEYGYYLAQNQN